MTTSYTYDYRNRLTGVTVGGTVTATYTYDALDRRIGVQDGGTQTWTVYDGKTADDQPYADFNGSGTLTKRYLSGPGVVLGTVVDQLLARTDSGGTTAWYLPDNLGTVRDIADTTVTIIYHAVYDSFGNVTSETNATNGDRFKFAGMQYDATVGQYYDHARWYGAGIGRFLAQDPIMFDAGDADLYRFVCNAPTDSADPSGEHSGENDSSGQGSQGEQVHSQWWYFPYLQALHELAQQKTTYEAELQALKNEGTRINRALKHVGESRQAEHLSILLALRKRQEENSIMQARLRERIRDFSRRLPVMEQDILRHYYIERARWMDWYLLQKRIIDFYQEPQSDVV